MESGRRMARVVLCDTSSAVCDGWRRQWQCSGRSNGSGGCGRAGVEVEVFHGTLDTLLRRRWDGELAVVSPGNSFGFLGGGFDLALFHRFGGEPFERWFREQLGGRYHPVGSATVVDLGGWKAECGAARYVVHVPTVVAPCRSVYDGRRAVASGYGRIFDAMWNALVSCPSGVEALVVSGLGTGWGGIPVEVACKSMVFGLRVFGLAQAGVSAELQNVLIMYYQGAGYRGFVSESCVRECERLGIAWEKLEKFDAGRDSIGDILPCVEVDL